MKTKREKILEKALKLAILRLVSNCVRCPFSDGKTIDPVCSSYPKDDDCCKQVINSYIKIAKEAL